MWKKYKSVILSCLALGAVLLAFFLYSEMNPASKPWSVVYLNTGRLYIGKLVTFPSFQLYEAYSIEKGQDPKDSTKETLQLVSLSGATWSPKKLYLVREQVIFYGPIQEDSVVVKSILGK